MSHSPMQMISREVIFTLFCIQRNCVQMSYFMARINLWPLSSLLFCVIVIHFPCSRLLFFLTRRLPHALSELESIVSICYVLCEGSYACPFYCISSFHTHL